MCVGTFAICSSVFVHKSVFPFYECHDCPLASPAVCRSSTPTCREWAASTTGCPSPCPPWTCSALESRCSTKPKRNSTSSCSSTTSAAGECRRLREGSKLMQVDLSTRLILILSWLRVNTCQEAINGSLPSSFFSVCLVMMVLSPDVTLGTGNLGKNLKLIKCSGSLFKVQVRNSLNSRGVRCKEFFLWFKRFVCVFMCAAMTTSSRVMNFSLRHFSTLNGNVHK